VLGPTVLTSRMLAQPQQPGGALGVAMGVHNEGELLLNA
jgi:hypothetical protein